MSNCFVDYWNFIYDIQVEDDEMLFYRGIGDKSFVMKPGILFCDKISESDAYHNALLESPEEYCKNDHLSNLAKMQHYGLPTRLLDISANPLVSLYFAVEQDKNGKDGAVEIFKVKKKEVLHHNSDKALMLACLPAFSDADKNELKAFCERHRGVISEQDIIFSNVMRRFVHEVRGECPAFEVAMVGQDLLDSFFVRPNKNNERMKVQDASFVIFGLDIESGMKMLERLRVARYIIPNKDKKEFLKNLALMRITNSTMYPGMERTQLALRDAKLGWKEMNE